MRFVEILLLASLASCSTERTPNVCCVSDTECARLGLPPGSVSEYSCSEGQVCRDFYCVPEEPIIDNGQRADLVLGQETFTMAEQNHGGISARSLDRPAGVTADEVGRLWVLDYANSRALMWNPAPPVSFAEATLVVGSASFMSEGGGCSGPMTFFTAGAQLAANGGKLLIPATSCNRVMIWNPIPATNGSAASTALGQASFSELASGNGAADLYGPRGVWTDGTRVAVADTRNNRVLIWTAFPITNKQPADIVLGQQDFGISEVPNTPTGATMRDPYSVYSDGVGLFVADAGNNRVLVWRSFPSANGQPADFAIGQPDLTSDGAGHGASQLVFPSDVTLVDEHLFVADSGNHRVLVFSPLPTTSGASASFVLGQPNFETNNTGTTQDTFNLPYSLAVTGNKLYVADTNNNRVLRFDLRR